MVRPVVFAAMRNPELYAVKIARGDILLEGQRRGRTEELEPWDGVLTERTVQAISPILSDTGQVGTVEVYLRVDKTLDPAHAANAQEMLRLFGNALFCALPLFLRGTGAVFKERATLLGLVCDKPWQCLCAQKSGQQSYTIARWKRTCH